MPKKFSVSDGKLVLFLEPAGGGWYAVTSPFDPGITTQAKSIEEAFMMAYDACKYLNAARADLARQLRAGTFKQVTQNRTSKRVRTRSIPKAQTSTKLKSVPETSEEEAVAVAEEGI